MQRIDSTGQSLWIPGGIHIREFALSLGLTYPSPDVTGLLSDDNGGCFVWWRDNGSLKLQHIDSVGGINWGSGGTPYWKREAVEAPLIATKLCSDFNNGVFGVYDNLEWGDSLDPTIDLGVLVQRVGADGQPVFDSNGVMVRQWPKDIDALPWDRFLSAAAAIPGGVITTWGDNRDQPDYSLYAQIVDTTGKVGSGVGEESIASHSAPILGISSTIASGNVSLRYSLPAKEMGAVKLYDVAGKLIKSQPLNQREGVITWNTQELPLGVYFVQLSTSNNERVSRKMLIVD